MVLPSLDGAQVITQFLAGLSRNRSRPVQASSNASHPSKSVAPRIRVVLDRSAIYQSRSSPDFTSLGLSRDFSNRYGPTPSHGFLSAGARDLPRRSAENTAACTGPRVLLPVGEPRKQNRPPGFTVNLDVCARRTVLRLARNQQTRPKSAKRDAKGRAHCEYLSVKVRPVSLHWARSHNDRFASRRGLPRASKVPIPGLAHVLAFSDQSM